VPDVSYVSNERLRELEGFDLEVPPFAPNVAIEVLSPGWNRRRLEHKIGVYLAGGSELVIVVDPRTRTAHLHDATEERVVRGDEAIEHAALPGFSLGLPALFAVLERPR
jgi:Uma2 family endonuclease